MAAIGAAIAEAAGEEDGSPAADAEVATAAPVPAYVPPPDQEEEKKAPVSEVDSLMDKYDNEEKHVAFVKSDAYKL